MNMNFYSLFVPDCSLPCLSFQRSKTEAKANSTSAYISIEKLLGNKFASQVKHFVLVKYSTFYLSTIGQTSLTHAGILFLYWIEFLAYGIYAKDKVHQHQM